MKISKLAALVVVCSVTFAALPMMAAADDVAVIVGFHGDTDAGVFAKHGGKATTDLSGLNAVAGRIPAGKIKALRGEPGVAYVEADLVRQPSDTIPNDTYYNSYQADDYALINCPKAWDLSKGDGVRVAVLDTGCQTNHADLSTKIAAKRNFTSNKTSDVSDKNGHGTHTAGTVGARTNNGTGVAGAGFNCSLAIGKVLGPRGGYDSWVAAGIDWARTTGGAKVINMSLGGEGSTTVLETAVNNAWNAGVVVVASAGNDGNNTTINYPGAYDNCISVAATNASGVLASFSNFGTTVDIAGPGVSVASTYKGSSYALMSGTSMSSPHVAGVVALIRSYAPAASAQTVRNRLLGSASLVVTTPDGSDLKVADAYASLLSTLE